MQICGWCRLPTRRDESLDVVQVDGVGIMAACPRCVAKAHGWPPPPPRTYPAGRAIPTVGTSLALCDMPICGLCRQALHWGEANTAIRLRAEFVDEEADGVRVGCYHACTECVERWRPRIAAYLRALKLLAADAPDEAASGDMLL